MLVFMISFIIFTITNTFFQNIKISLIVFVFCLGALTIFLFIKHKKRFFANAKFILILTLSFVISLWAILFNQYNYSPELVNSFLGFDEIPVADFVNDTGMTVEEKEKSVFAYLIWTGKIVDAHSYGKYIFQNISGEEYILNTEKKYQIWDSLRLVWYIKGINLLANKSSLSWLWNRSFDYDKWLVMKWYVGNIYEGNSIVLNNDKTNKIASPTLAMTGNLEINKLDSSLSSEWQELGFIAKIKRSLQSQIYSTYGEGRNAGLILWMLIWDKSQIPKSDYQNFIDSGLVHLIAVSGWNIIMLTIFLWFILFFLPFYLRNLVILVSIILYSMVCWMDSSVVRAVLFGWLGMVALFVGRETNFRRSVYIIFIVMLLINPYFLLYDLWFLLSFGAIIGIRIFSWKKIIDSSLSSEWQLRLVKILTKVYKSYIKPSIWANIWIFPIIIFFMWKINLVWFIANLFVLPIVPFVMIYGFISMFLCWLFPRYGFVFIEELLINYIYKVSEIASHYWIYLLVEDYRIKNLILILFIIWLIIYMFKNKIISNRRKVGKPIHKIQKQNVK